MSTIRATRSPRKGLISSAAARCVCERERASAHGRERGREGGRDGGKGSGSKRGHESMEGGSQTDGQAGRDDQ